MQSKQSLNSFEICFSHLLEMPPRNLNWSKIELDGKEIFAGYHLWSARQDLLQIMTMIKKKDKEDKNSVCLFNSSG